MRELSSSAHRHLTADGDNSRHAPPRSHLLTAALTLTLLACAGQAGAVAAEKPPAELARVYAVAGVRFGIAPELLAAIGYNESRHGRSRLPGCGRGSTAPGVAPGRRSSA